jgi:anoctamin-10
MRSDAVKICIEMQRPVPWRADTIGPWLDHLGFLAWLGSLTSAALVYMFTGDVLGPDGTPWNIKGWGLLLTIFFSEHIYIGVRMLVSTIIHKMESEALQTERREKFLVRKRYLEESVGSETAATAAHGLGGSHDAEKVGAGLNRKSLEDEARETSLKESKPEDAFWARQIGWQETVQIGTGLIKRAAPEGKKEK